MILYTFPAYETMAHALGLLNGLHHGGFKVGRFANGEMHAELETSPARQTCVVLGSIAPPDEAMLAVLLLCHTLKKEGAGRVIALLPYLGYARHDRQEPCKSLGAAWVGALLKASGADKVVTVDVHSQADELLFPLPLHSLSPASLLADRIRGVGWHEATIVAPDEGAQERCEAVRRALDQDQSIAYFHKERTREGVKHLALHGKISGRAVIVDDILDTGGTLVSACEALRNVGVTDIGILVTHGLFTGAGWEQLRALGVTEISCTDSVPLRETLALASINVLSVATILAEYLIRESTNFQEKPT